MDGLSTMVEAQMFGPPFSGKKRSAEYIDKPEAGNAAGEIIANPKMPQETFFEIFWKEKEEQRERREKTERNHGMEIKCTPEKKEGQKKKKPFSEEFKKKVQAAYNQLYEDRKHLLYDDSDEETCFAMDWYYEMKKFDEEYFGAQNPQIQRKECEGSASASSDIKRIKKLAEEYATVSSEERALDEENMKEIKERLDVVRKDIAELAKGPLSAMPPK